VYEEIGGDEYEEAGALVVALTPIVVLEIGSVVVEANVVLVVMEVVVVVVASAPQITVNVVE
jgi:hypothetical protein